MDNPIKVDLLSPSEVPCSTLMTWLQGVDFKSHHLRVVQASNGKGVIMHVYFIRVDDAFLITATVFDPKSTKEDDEPCGKAIDLFLEQRAQLEGVTTLFTMKAGGKECALVSTYTPRITQLQPRSPVVYVN